MCRSVTRREPTPPLQQESAVQSVTRVREQERTLEALPTAKDAVVIAPLHVSWGGHAFAIRFHHTGATGTGKHRTAPTGTECMIRLKIARPYDLPAEVPFFGDGPTIARGRAACAPGDEFSYATGRRVALTRALRPLKREVRRAFWQAYHGRTDNPPATSKKEKRRQAIAQREQRQLGGVA